MQKNFVTRHKIVQSIRNYFDHEGFIEIETPYMIKNTPGGARNFITPSRIFPGQFFALAESPQIFSLRQRGLSAEDAVSMIVNGFCKQVFRELPMEFAVEAQKLLGVSLEGSVG